MPGQLFTHDFLTHGIRATIEWKEVINRPAVFAAFRDGIRSRYEAFATFHDPNEAVTEQELIRPVLELLGWTEYLPQQGAIRNEDVPDLLLFSDPAAKKRAAKKRKPNERYRDAAVVEESKRFRLPLDSRGDDGTQSRTPHGQILGYLSTADEITSEGRIRWGILTNGGTWRLYDHRCRPRASGYFEADLAELIQPGREDDLRVFLLLFRRDSVTPLPGATTSFLEAALVEGRRYEERVAQDLSGIVFERVFPSLVRAMADATNESLTQIREAALIFLYRLLFVLYAEDRGLLPVNDSRYDDYGLRKRVRDDVARRRADGDAFSTHATNYYDHLMTLFRLIDKGDASIGLPPYNGGLFASETAALLERMRLADAEIAPIIDDLSHSKDPGQERRFVNYRDMSVQQLGSIYERLLEREPVRDENGTIVIRPNPYARKDSGSFFTPQELVDLIVDRTLKPLAEERLKAFEAKAAELKRDRRPKAERRADLLKLDPAEAILNLKVLDPAMGSGHFLVTAVDFLSDYVAHVIDCTPSVPEWLKGQYVSPLVQRVETIRRDILQRAKESNWVIDETLLTDQAIIRRMVLKRCIYGVDKNPLTVELAKVSLWLHSFTVGAPLSFLDHHLRYGDSLVGLRVAEATEDLRKMASMFLDSAIAAAEAAAEGMQRIEERSDADVAEVRESATLFQGVEETTAELRGLLNFLCGFRWLIAGRKPKERAEFEDPLVTTLGHTENPYKLLTNGPEHVADVPSKSGDAAWLKFAELWDQARAIVDREGFLHWEAAFPGVWRHWQNASPEGGFDAAIGNPPWDRIKLQEVEWFATRDPELALAPTAAVRKAAVQRLRKQGAVMADQFDAAKEQAEGLSRMIRSSGHYPLLSGGDINLYSLFVERAMTLLKPDGLVGLLTPSGIYADKTAAKFFKSVSTGGRVAGLFDFENRRLGTALPPFFPDVDSRFKFCALIFGGEDRRFDETTCAFFLHDTRMDDPDCCFSLTPDDFARVNPNTCTAPVFRTRRDAEITRRIYERHPVLVDRSRGNETWPIRYRTMFHMTNDSHLFRTAPQLEADGSYPVKGNQWKKGNELYLPLYQGRMIWHFDHRANSVHFNPKNMHNPYLSQEVIEAQHADPDFLPQTRYGVPASAVEPVIPQTRGWALGFRDITNPTNVRTMVASIVPWAGYSNKLPFLIRDDGVVAMCLLANLNAMCLDFVVRQKMHGTSLNLFIVEQLPVIAPDDYNRQFGNTTARDLVRDHVLRLTYTAHDVAPFARDLGYDGPPFIWDEEDRRHLRARLDALYFHLYGITRDDAEYILSTFPIVRREDTTRFGTYRTRNLILAYMNALTAGDTDTVVAV